MFVTIPCFSPHHCTTAIHSTHPLRICSWRTSTSISLSASSANSFTGAKLQTLSRPKSLRRRGVIPKVPISVIGGGGFLGVGPAEIIVIIGVGWLFLGPEKLYSLSKDIGKIIGELRRTADEAKDSFSDALDYEMSQSTSVSQPSSDSDDTKADSDDEKADSDDEKADSAGDKEIEAPLQSPIGDAIAQEHHIDTNIAPSLSEADALHHAKHSKSDQPSSGHGSSLGVAPLDISALESSNRENPLHTTADEVDLHVQHETSALFLDQLKRVSDPHQVAPSEVPDLDIGTDMEELEVQRLEKQYLEARARLEERKNSLHNHSNHSTGVSNVSSPSDVDDASAKPTGPADIGSSSA